VVNIATPHTKYASLAQNTQNSPKNSRVGADLCRKFLYWPSIFANSIRDAKFSDDMKAP
jgi:hypothetical protein